MVTKSKSVIKNKSKSVLKTKSKTPIKKILTKKKVGLSLVGTGLLAYYLYKNKKLIDNLSEKEITDYNKYLSDFKLDDTEVVKYHEFVFINGKKRRNPPPKEFTTNLDKKINTNTDFIEFVNINRKKRGYKPITIQEIHKNFEYRNKNAIKELVSLKEKFYKDQELNKEILYKINKIRSIILADIRNILYPFLTINKYAIKKNIPEMVKYVEQKIKNYDEYLKNAKENPKQQQIKEYRDKALKFLEDLKKNLMR